MAKWNEPKGAAPAWLDPALEVTAPEPKLSTPAFVVAVVGQLLAAGVGAWQAVEVCANSLNETARGQKYRAANLGGWKITRDGARAYARAHGRKPRWYRAPGNKAPGATLTNYRGGDPPWCWYWGFDSFADYLARWMARFAPRPRPADTRAALERAREQTANYRLAGFLLWTGDEAWFGALCDAGYKGENTDADWRASAAAHRALARETRVLFAQAKLPALVVDGRWGPRSTAAAQAFQAQHGLPATGEPDDATLTALAAAQESHDG